MTCIKTHTAFSVEYARISGNTGGGAPDRYSKRQQLLCIGRKILVLDNSVSVERARNILWRREKRKLTEKIILKAHHRRAYYFEKSMILPVSVPCSTQVPREQKSRYSHGRRIVSTCDPERGDWFM